MDSRHMERSTPSVVLHIGGSPCLDEQFHTQGSVVRKGSVVEGSLPLVVLSTDGYVTLEEGVHDNILTVATGNVERCASVIVDCIWL